MPATESPREATTDRARSAISVGSVTGSKEMLRLSLEAYR
jgi:hypothetical protein